MATTGEQTRTAVKTVMIVDDHPVLRRGLTALIESESDLTVCGEAASADEAMELIGTRRPHLVIVDLTLDDSDGLELVKAMKAKHPDIPALVLSMHDEVVYAERSLKAGAKGYVSKQQLDETVLIAIRCVLTGETYMSDTLKSRLAMKFIGGRTAATGSPLDALSDRELQVFELIGGGLSTRDVAGTLKLSVKTVESHVEHIKHKMNLESGTELTQRAIRWVEMGDAG